MKIQHLIIGAMLCIFTALQTGAQSRDTIDSSLPEPETITRVAYATEETIASTDTPKTPDIFKNSGEIPLAIKTNVTPETPQIRTIASVQKRNGLIKIGVGIAAIAFGAVTYSMLSKDHKDYKNLISTPEGFTSYASPGIYVSGGAAAAGLGVSLTSLYNFKKARK